MAAPPRAAPPTPPQRGSFPLDHDGVCKAAAAAYLACIRTHGTSHAACRDASRAYLQCRMDSGLMAREDLDSMGFAAAAAPVVGQASTTVERGERIAGMAAAGRAKGGLFGLTLPGSGDATPGTGRRGGGHG